MDFRSEPFFTSDENRRLSTMKYHNTLSRALSRVNFEHCSIAGSYPLWCMLLTINSPSAFNWTPRDVDVFCFDKEKFKTIVDTFETDISADSNYRVVKKNETFKALIVDLLIESGDLHFNVSFINAWRPRESYLEGFDLSSCKVSIDSPSLEPVPLDESVMNDIRSMKMGVLRDMSKKTKATARTAARILKYLGRGFSVYYVAPTLDESRDNEWATKYQLSDDEYDRMIGTCIRRYSALHVIDQLLHDKSSGNSASCGAGAPNVGSETTKSSV